VELHAAVGTLAAYRADWDQVQRSTDASTELAEREGLVSKLCVPYALRALLWWRDGDLDRAEQRFREAQGLADQVGWSELSFQSLFGLALVLRDRGDYAEAVAVLESAEAVCERAGLAAQSVQAGATRAVVLALDGRGQEARVAAAEADALAVPLNSPTGQAATLEARGAAAEDPDEGAELLADAESLWAELERPLEAARCALVAGFRLREHDPSRARALLDRAGAECERLGVAHLAERTRALVAGA
jgi:tetratricopeptide (TPR) repeat protein